MMAKMMGNQYVPPTTPFTSDATAGTPMALPTPWLQDRMDEGSNNPDSYLMNRQNKHMLHLWTSAHTAQMGNTRRKGRGNAEPHTFAYDEAEDQNNPRQSRSKRLSEDAKDVLLAWILSPEHFHHPYPTKDEKQRLSAATGTTVKQLTTWFSNARKRFWQPMIIAQGRMVEKNFSLSRQCGRKRRWDFPPPLGLMQQLAPGPSSMESVALHTTKRRLGDLEPSGEAVAWPSVTVKDREKATQCLLQSNKRHKEDPLQEQQTCYEEGPLQDPNSIYSNDAEERVLWAENNTLKKRVEHFEKQQNARSSCNKMDIKNLMS
jgi:hypothetical protein